MQNTKVFIIAGEVSGDLHGANLIKEINSLGQNIEFIGWGGDRMEKEGMTILKHVKTLSFMGFLEVLLNLKTIIRNIKDCKNQIIATQPAALILIDFPGFNLRIAKWAKKHNIPVIYYISPQIWAWKESRVKTIRRDVSKMYCILPFEQQFYAKFNVDVSYLGHPLLDEITEFRLCESPKIIVSSKPILALLPGSRLQEVKRKLPLMIEASRSFPHYQVVVACSINVGEAYYRLYADDTVQLIFGKTYEILNQSSIALVTSGTATLETALFNVPQVVCYKSSPLSFAIAKLLVKIKYISLANLIMNKEVVSELIQGNCTVDNMVQQLRLIEVDQPKRLEILLDYQNLATLLGQNGASKRVAEDILETFFDTNGIN
jgi:lipid-A-disaccharide synthase